MANRRGPEAGYDFGNKRQYRRTIWAIFRELCVGRLHEAQALLMPSIEGDEIAVALSKGFREHNLHVVDRNPAIVATLKRRFPAIHTYGVDVDVAARRIAAAGARLSVANLDLCSQVSPSLLRVVSDFVAAGAMLTPTSAVAVTVLRGREAGTVEGEIESWAAVVPRRFGVPTRDVGRAAMLIGALRSGLMAATSDDSAFVSPLRFQKYRSSAGTQSMLFSVFGLVAPGRWLDDNDPLSYLQYLNRESFAVIGRATAG